jgi:tetratricopeptide (TPR) repeat protein
MLASALQLQGAYSEAESESRAVNAAAPGRADALFQLAHALAAQDRMEEAIERIAEALDRPPVTQLQLFHVRKIIARAPGPKALEVARRSVEMFPMQSEVLEPLVRVLMREDRLDEALEVARRGRKLSGAPPGLGLLVTRILVGRGELEAAESEIESVLAKHPGVVSAQQLRDKISSKLARRRAAYQDGPMVTSTTLRSP